MRRGRHLYALVIVLLAGLVVLACEQTSEEDEQAAKLAAEWTWLQEAKAELDGKREKLAQAQDHLAKFVPAEEDAAGEEGSGEEGEAAEAPPSLEDLTAQAEAVQQEVYKLGDAFGSRLAQFINDQQIGVESELTTMQRQALDLKGNEDILLAQEYIDKGGEYQQAIDIYERSLEFDPGNGKLLEAKARAEELQYMSEERFGQIKKGMTQSEVRELLGTPKASNVREYEDRGVTAWYYPKADPPRSAAGVFFQEKKGELKVYKIDYEAIKAEDIGA